MCEPVAADDPVAARLPDAATFVAAHQPGALALGRRLADLVDDPGTFVADLEAGLPALVDPAYQAMVASVSPGTDGTFAVRGPLREAVMRPVRGALREGSSASALWLAQALAEAGHRDLRLYALPCLRRSLPEDPEQAWQLLRRMAARAADWIEVDSLAEVWAVGVLAEAFRWAELEQLVYSPRPYERRLVGATLATLPHRLPATQRAAAAGMARPAMDLVALLMGDAEEVVQKALSWAIRNWTRFAPQATRELLLAETEIAVRDADGARAWVIRDSLSHQPSIYDSPRPTDDS
jgi:3-methyladenine DNA glycosylase AlkD